MNTFIFLISAFAIGAFQIGAIIGGKKTAQSGSGNLGGTNVGRTKGKVAGAMTFVLDGIKGAFVVHFFPQWFETLQRNGSPETMIMNQCLLGIAVILGHCYSPLSMAIIKEKKQTGKGMMPLVGVMLVIAPVWTLYSFVVFLVTWVASSYVSVGSVVSVFSFPAFILLTYLGAYSSVIPGSEFLISFGVIMGFFVRWTHRENFVRLEKGDENPSKNAQKIQSFLFGLKTQQA